MNATRPSGSIDSYADLIGYLQRTELDDQGLQIPADEVKEALRLAVDLDKTIPVWLTEVRGVSRFWQTGLPQETGSNYFTEDILAGLNGQRLPLCFLVQGQSKRVHIYIGTMDEGGRTGPAVRTIFGSQYPGVKLWPEDDLSGIVDADKYRRTEIKKQWEELQHHLKATREFIAGCQHVGIVTGVPTPNVGKADSAGTQIDRLLRGLYGTEWAFLVLAEPEQDSCLAKAQLAMLQEQTRVEQEERVRGWSESSRQSVASYYYQLLEMRRQFLEACLYRGGWWVQSYICSPDSDTYQRARALVKSVFSGDFSRVDRIRVLECPGIGPKAASFSPMMVERDAPGSSLERRDRRCRSFKYRTLVSSTQLSALIHLPRAEMPGYHVRESALFDVSSHVPSEREASVVKVGEILGRGRPTGNDYRVCVEDLTKHCLLVGITGSGKTNTGFHLLRQLQECDRKVAFLVIEPAKREYRRLAKLLPEGTELRVFTVGEEGTNAAPFRLNPFEIRSAQGHKGLEDATIPVQTHIDLLKSVFNASFGMWTPLPQVLERAIHEIYRDRGWDPIHSTNERAAVRAEGRRAWHPRAHPTLTDLYHKVSEMVPKLGYDKEVTRNVTTALETRINSLRVGAKGMMLDTPLSIPVEHLLDKPTVLELEGVGDDDEKAFIMGLVLIALYEYYRTQETLVDSGLRHVTVVEEAHRLLTNVPTSTDPEATNLRGKAVETFVNMLSEVRAYGEGFIIAEQIPTKLAPDVIKNTALKIMHRTVSNDDRGVMGGAMNLDAKQLRQVVSLGTGEAVVHGGGRYGDDNAILVKVPRAKGEGRAMPTPTDIRRLWDHFTDQEGLTARFLPYPTCEQHCNPPNPRCNHAAALAEDPAVEETFAAFVISLVAESSSRGKKELEGLSRELYPPVRGVLRSHITGPGEYPAETRCTLTHALYHYMDKRGAQYGWKYEDVAHMTSLLLPAVLGQVGDKQLQIDDSRIAEFCREYANHCSLGFDPFHGCTQACPGGHQGIGRLCLFRYNVEPYLDDPLFDKDYEKSELQNDELVDLARRYTNRVVHLDETTRAFGSAALCLLIQKVHRDLSLSLPGRRNLIDDLIHYRHAEKE